MAAGEHFAVRVEKLPGDTTAGVALSVHTGEPAFDTSTTTLAVGPTPWEETPATVKVEVTKGATVQVALVLTEQGDPVQT